MADRPTMIAIGLGAGGLVVLGEGTVMLAEAMGTRGSVYGFTVFEVPIAVPISIVSVLIGVVLLYGAMNRRTVLRTIEGI